VKLSTPSSSPEVKNEWRYTSAPPLRLLAVEWENLTCIFYCIYNGAVGAAYIRDGGSSIFGRDCGFTGRFSRLFSGIYRRMPGKYLDKVKFFPFHHYQ
jgi:hypothetical protein